MNVAGETRVELREVEVDGRTVRYRVAGSGEPLVLVHGLAGSWRWWLPLLHALGARRRVSVVDLPRLHPPVRPDRLSEWLGRWLDAAGLEQVDLAGHSLGGLVAAELASAESARTRRLVLVAPAGIPCGRSLPSRAAQLLVELYGARRWLPMVAADALRTGPVDVVRGIAFVSARDLRAELAAVRAPTLLVWGERDRLVPLHVAEEWRQTLPDARLAYLSCGHVPMLEAPRQLADSMLSFLDEELVNERSD
jgi:pimeloyl-ACP methyl ester carboxylesterase